MKQLLATALIVSVASSAFAAKFGEAPGDLNAPMNTYGNPNADLVAVEVTNDASTLFIKLTTNSTDISNPNWIKLNVAMRAGSTFPLSTASTIGWPRNFGMDGGANMYIGGWVDGGGGFEFRTFNGTDWGGGTPAGATWLSTPGMTVSFDGGPVTYALPISLMGLSMGDSITFDATTTGGFDGDGAWDPISITKGQITAPDQNTMVKGDLRYTLAATPAVQNVTLPVTFGGTEASWAVNRAVNYKVRQNGFIVASGFISANSSASNFVMEVPAGVTGPVVIEVDGAQFLRRLIPANLTGSDATLGSQLVKNGDVDDNGEVDLTDIDLIIGAYLTAGGSNVGNITDLDNNGEVDLTDIDIAIGNYLEGDDN